MQVKRHGESRPTNCKFIPGMALAFGVSPIGAHHKESWIIHVRGQADHARVLRARQGPEDRRPAADPRRPLRVDRHLRFPWLSSAGGVEHYPTYFNTITGQGLEARGLLAHLRPDLRADEAVLAARVSANGPLGRLPPAAWFDPANADTEGRSPA